MKQLLLCIICVAFISIKASAQEESTGLPGDHFSLQGALEMFKKASSPEEFEKLINSQDKNVNNLDLNEDGEIDYVKVIDKTDNKVHAFVLQVAVSETENQDIAVIELEKTGDTTAVLQIIGDEEIYGEQIIVEASDEGDEISNNDDNGTVPGGPAAGFFEMNRIVINVFYWPSVRFIYRPVYVPWVSPWRWRHYPGWWRPWRPLAWSAFHPLRLRYHRHCAIVRTHRVIGAHRVYMPYRVSSVTVRTRTTVVRNNYRVNRSNRRVIINNNRGNGQMRNNNGNNGNGNRDKDGNGKGNGKGKGRKG